MRRPGGRPAAFDGYASADAGCAMDRPAPCSASVVCGAVTLHSRCSGSAGRWRSRRTSARRCHADWRIWSELAHPHVLPVADYGEGNDSLYVATQWLNGPSLRAVLDQRRTLDAAQTRELATQLASALDAAAAAGLIHLDVKPENVLFASDGAEHAYVRDFGAGRLAAWHAGVDRSGTFQGTLEYSAPEQIEGDAVDGRTLVYALACLLYETLTGATPYAGRSSAALMRAHVEEAPPLVGSGAADLDRVFATALAKRPDERYATCAELASALDAALASAPAPRPARGTRRRPVVTSAPGHRRDVRRVRRSCRRDGGFLARAGRPAPRMRLKTSPSATARSLRRCRRPTRRSRPHASRSAWQRVSRESPRGRRRAQGPSRRPDVARVGEHRCRSHLDERDGADRFAKPDARYCARRAAPQLASRNDDDRGGAGTRTLPPPPPSAPPPQDPAPPLPPPPP